MEEKVRPSVRSADELVLTHHRQRERDLLTVFGLVTAKRMTYGARCHASLSPFDASLNLPEELYSHGLRRLAAVEAARGSFDATVEAIERNTGTTVPKRQAEELVQKAAKDFDAFYERPESAEVAASEDDLLVLTLDGKGIVMRHEDLRAATRKAAENAQHKMGRRLSKGEKRDRKRMATVAAVYDLTPEARRLEDVLAELRPVQDASKSRPRARNKRVWARARETLGQPSVLPTNGSSGSRLRPCWNVRERFECHWRRAYRETPHTSVRFVTGLFLSRTGTEKRCRRPGPSGLALMPLPVLRTRPGASGAGYTISSVARLCPPCLTLHGGPLPGLYRAVKDAHMTATLLALVLGTTPLKVGDQAPDFTLPDQDGTPVTLSKALSNGPVILAFFPKAFTPGCTKQNSNFRDQYSEVATKGAQVFGISVDDVKTQRRFRDELKLPYPLLSDEGGKVSKEYSGTMPIVGLAYRANFVIGQNGRVTRVVEGSEAVDPNSAIASCPGRKTH